MRIFHTIYAFSIYGLLSSLIVYSINEYLPFLSLRYSIIFFMILAAFISAFTFLYENSGDRRLRSVFLILLAFSSLAYLLYLIVNATSLIHADGVLIGVDYSLIISLFLVPFALRYSQKFLELRIEKN
ncbi:MAG: hypothetical protein ACPLVI_06600 [Thermoplasmata archaeon]